MKAGFIFFLCLLFFTNHIASSVTVLGAEGAALCYQEAARGGSGRLSINTCHKALRDEALSKKDRSGTQVNFGIVLNNSFLPDRALKSFGKARDSEELLPEIILNSGNSYFIKMEFLSAIEHYDESIKGGIRDQSAAFYNKGLAYEMLKNMQKAVENYKKAALLKADPVYLEKKRKLIAGGYWQEEQ